MVAALAFLGSPAAAQPQPGKILSTTTQDIFECNIDSSNCFVVAGHGDNGVSAQPSVASNGTIAFWGYFTADPYYNGNQQILLMNGDGTNPRQITNFTVSNCCNNLWPTISPDGSRVAFLASHINAAPDGSSPQEIYVVNSDGSNLHQVTPFIAINNDYSQSSMIALAWSPDSTKLAFRGQVYTAQCGTYFGNPILVSAVGTINADGTNMQVLACDNNDGYVSSLDWSPDGTLLAWGRNISHCAQGGSGCAGEPAMAFYDFSGQNRYAAGIMSAQLGTDSCQEGPHCIHFSPDSSRLAYASQYAQTTCGGLPCVSLINLDGSGQANTTLQISNGLWWMPGTALPVPAHLTLAGSNSNAPNTVEVWPGFPQQLIATLEDASLNSIFHSAATYSTGSGQPGLNNCLNIGPYGLAFYVNEGGSGYDEYDGVTATNAGLTSNPIVVKCWPSSPCTFLLGSTSTNIGTTGGTGSVSVIANPGTNQSTCPWTATTSYSWITITSRASGSGNGSVGFSVAANSGGARQGTIVIAGLTYTVNQSGGGSTVLQSITVTPNPASVAAGLTVQFTATGNYSDGSMQNLTASVTWSSSNTGIASINASGLATGVAQGGPVTITAWLNSISGTASLTVTAALLTSIAVTPANPSVAAGANQQFAAIGTYSDGSTQTITGTVTWSSSNTAVATISASGLASALTAGTSSISAKSGAITGSTMMTVIALQSITVTPANPSVFVGSTQQFGATGTYSDGSKRDLTSTAGWASSNANVATITSPGGLATGLAKGTAMITASSGNISGSTTLTVSAVVLQSITVSPATATIAAGGTQQFTATGHYSNGTTQDLTMTAKWSSSSKKVASVSGTGLATGVSPGTATISVSMGGAKGSMGSAMVTVQP